MSIFCLKAKFIKSSQQQMAPSARIPSIIRITKLFVNHVKLILVYTSHSKLDYTDERQVLSSVTVPFLLPFEFFVKINPRYLDFMILQT